MEVGEMIRLGLTQEKEQIKGKEEYGGIIIFHTSYTIGMKICDVGEERGKKRNLKRSFKKAALKISPGNELNLFFTEIEFVDRKDKPVWVVMVAQRIPLTEEDKDDLESSFKKIIDNL